MPSRRGHGQHGPRDGQGARDHEHPRDDGDDGVADPDAPDRRGRGQAVAGCRLGHHGLQPHGLAHGRRPVPGVVEPVERAVERRDGRGAVPAAVVQQHHLARRGAVHDGALDRIRVRRLPVAGVLRREHREVALVARVPDGRPHRVVDRRVRRGVGRPQQRRGPPGRLDDRELRGVDLDLATPRGGRGEVDVREGVHAELVAFGDDAPREVGVVDHGGADREECRGGAVLAQDVQDARRPLRIGPVVERERHGARRG
jgi:hypothetical protein